MHKELPKQEIETDEILEWYRSPIGFNTGMVYKTEDSARPKNLVDGESYQPFIVWEEVENTDRAI